MERSKTLHFWIVLLFATLISKIVNQPHAPVHSNYGNTAASSHWNPGIPLDPAEGKKGGDEESYQFTVDGPNFSRARMQLAMKAASLGTEVELSIRAADLRDRDIFSKSDPMCVTYIRSYTSNEWTEYHRTEAVRDNLNPVFAKKPIIPDSFGEKHSLMFRIYDVDSSRARLEDHDYLGYTECNFGELISREKMTLWLRSKNYWGVETKTKAHLIIRAENLISNYDEVSIDAYGTSIESKDWFGKSDPFLEIYKASKGDEYELVYKTEVIDNTDTPRWRPFVIPMKNLCNGNHNRVLKFVCWDHDAKGRRDFIGEFKTTLYELRYRKRTFDLTVPRKGNRVSGQIHFSKFDVLEVPSFADFIANGLRIHAAIAIDFTGSNGDPRVPGTLHYRNPNGAPNSYEDAILSAVPAVEEFDSDKVLPVFGIGARNRGGSVIQHAFKLNQSFDGSIGVHGVLKAYRQCLPTLEFVEPTYFAPVIRNITQTARAYQTGDDYFILLLFTDGEISDIQETEKVRKNRTAIG